MNKFQFFWDTMELCDWSHEGDDSQEIGRASCRERV